MEDKLRPIIIHNKVSNLDGILNTIRECDDEELLNEYLMEVREYSSSYNIEGLSEIAKALEIRLNDIIITDAVSHVVVEVEEQKTTVPVSEEKMQPNPPEIIEDATSLQNANILIAKLFDHKNLTSEEFNELNNYVKTSLNKLLDDKIDYNYQNTIDMYIVYLEEKEVTENINRTEREILNEYRRMIKQREQKITQEELNNESMTLRLSSSHLNTNGAIVTVVVLEVTLLLGILISVIALVKR